MRPSPLVVVAVVMTAAGAPAPSSAAAVPVVVIEGRGHGHGVGMAQDGALAMGRAGSSTPQILSQFYPGTRLGRSGGEVRVPVLTAGNEVVIGFPNGGEVRDAREGGQSAGFPVRVAAGGRARLRFDGRRYLVEVASGAVGRLVLASVAQDQSTTTTTTTAVPGLLPPLNLPPIVLPSLPPLPPLLPGLLPDTTTTTGPAPAAATAPPATTAGQAASERPLWAVPSGGGTVDVVARGHRYRGVVHAAASGGLRLVNHVDVEQYLRGMGEVRDPRWPAASLRAQAIAARTYALRAMAGGGELCDTQLCQVYLGAQAEYGAMDKAVTATRGQVLLFGRGLASTVYSSNGGGFSASTEEGFGTPGAGYPYLRPASYPTRDPLPWTVTVAARDVAARVGYRGRVTAVRAAAAGPSGRVLQVTVEGTRGSRTVSGIEFDKALGLKSTLFTLRLDNAATDPPPPPPAEGGPTQALPGGAEAGSAPVETEAAPAGETAAFAATGPGDAGAGASAAGASSPSGASKAGLGGLASLLLLAVVTGMIATQVAGVASRPAAVPAAPIPPVPAGDAVRTRRPGRRRRPS